MRNFIYRILLFCATIAIVVLLHVFQPKIWNSVRLAAEDLRYLFSDLKPSDDVVFIDVDAASVDRFGRWPWDRKILADALSRLHESQVVVLDMVFSESTNENADLYFSKAIASLGNVVGGFYFTDDSNDLDLDAEDYLSLNGPLSQISIHRFEAYSNTGIEHSIPTILEAYAWNASFSIMPDVDDYLRRYSVFFQYGDIVFPSLGTAALRLFLNEEIVEKQGLLGFGERQFLTDSQGQVLLHLYPADSFNRYSFVDLFEGKIASEKLENKIIILGVSEAGVSDIVTTPLGRIPGPLVHASFMSNIIEGHLPKSTSRLLYFGSFFCVLFPFILCLLVSRSWVRGIAYLSFVFFISYYAFRSYSVDLQLVGYPYWFLCFLLSFVFQEFCSSYTHEKRWRVARNSLGQGGRSLQDEWLKSLKNKLEKPFYLTEILVQFDHQFPESISGYSTWNKAFIEEIRFLNEVAAEKKGLVLNASDLGCRVVFGISSGKKDALQSAIYCAQALQKRWAPSHDGKIGDLKSKKLNPMLSICSGEGMICVAKTGSLKRLTLLGPLRFHHQKQIKKLPFIPGRIFIGGNIIRENLGVNNRLLYMSLNSYPVYEIQPDGEAHQLIFERYKNAEEAYQNDDDSLVSSVLDQCAELYLDPLSVEMKKLKKAIY